MSRRLTAMLVAVAALAMLLMGCGAGDGSGADARSSDGRTRGLTQAEYVRRADQICATHRAQISAALAGISRELSKGGTVSRAEVTEAMEDVMLPGFRAEFEDLRALPSPSEDEDFHLLMLLKFASSLERGEANLERFFRVKASGYSEFAEGTLMTQEYGVKGCGSLGRSAEAVVRDYALR